MTTKKLTPAMQELLDAINSGVVVHYMPYMGRFNQNAYYFRADNHKRCTAAVNGLRKRGLVEVVSVVRSGGHDIVAKKGGAK